MGLKTKHVGVELPVEYLEQAAKQRGITRTHLVRLLMEAIIERELVPSILGTEKLPPPNQENKYRRFKPKGERDDPRAAGSRVA
jgi:hypothetical protein